MFLKIFGELIGNYLKKRFSCEKWMAGNEPEEERNHPYEFFDDMTFRYVQHNIKGFWVVKVTETDLVIETVGGGNTLEWKFTEFTETSMKLKVNNSTTPACNKWRLMTYKDSDYNDEVIIMTLKSSSGQALVVNHDKKDSHENIPIRWFKLGPTKDALKIKFIKTATGYYLKLDHEYSHFFECYAGKYDDGTDMVAWRNHYGDNQIFVVN